MSNEAAHQVASVKSLAYSWMEDLERAEQAPERGWIPDQEMSEMRLYADAGARILSALQSQRTERLEGAK